MPRRYYSSTAARTTLASGVNNSTTTFTVVAVSGWPSSFPYTLIIDQDTINEEVVNVTARTGTTLTVERGQDGTSAVSHSAGAAVNHGVSARDFNEPNQFLNEGGTVTGPTLVSANSASTALEVRQTGAGLALRVEDETNPDATPFVVDASGNVGIGTSSPATALHISGDSQRQVNLDTYVTSANGSSLVVRKSRGTAASPTTVASGDTIGVLRFDAYDGSTFVQGAAVVAAVDSTPGAGDMPTALIFSTTADGASSRSERMRITSAGNVGIGTSSPGSRLNIRGASAEQTTFVSEAFGNNTAYSMRRYNGIVGSPTVVASGDVLGNISFQGYDGAAIRDGASIRGGVDGTPGSSDMPGNLQFLTTADGSATLTERMRIDNAGLITGTGTSLGAWTAYTPTLGGTGWALGNGTATGAYCQIGKIVHFRGRITLGSTSTAGAGALTLTYPVNINSGLIVTLLFRDASAAVNYSGTVTGVNTSTFAPASVGAGGLIASLTTNAPFTWATGDFIDFAGTYEAA